MSTPKKLVLIVDVVDAGFLKGQLRRLPAALNEALMTLGMSLRLEDLFVVHPVHTDKITENINECADAYDQLLANEKYPTTGTPHRRTPHRRTPLN